jgi:hypothetical protein
LDSLRLSASYLVQDWLIKAVFEKPNMLGFVKEYFLHAYCRRNLQLASHIMYKIITLQDWEADTPEAEKIGD